MRRLVPLGFVLVLLASSATAVQSPEDGLVLDRGRTPQRHGAETHHPLRIDRRRFEDAAPGSQRTLPGKGSSITPARTVRGLRHGRDFTWVGKVATAVGEQTAVITFGDDATFGTIPQAEGAPLRVETHGGQAWLVEGENRKRMHDGGRDDARVPPAAGSGETSGTPPAAAATTATATGSAPVIDVLVVYTPSLVTATGSSSAALTRLSYLESLTNQAYADSGANVRIRVVARQLLNYTAATDNGTLLNLITDPSTNTVKKQVDAWRQQAGADLVIVLRHFNAASMDDCGQGWIGGYHGSAFDPGYAFAVAGDGSDGGYYCTDQTFAHELGHNMGLHHDSETSGNDYGAYAYSRGYRQTLSTSSGFATVMAYSTGPQVTLNVFSTPLLTSCKSRPCGVANVADAVRSLGNTAARVAAFRTAVPGPAPTLSVSDIAIAEGNSGTRTASFVVTPSSAPSSSVSFDLATQNGTATAGTDYVATGILHQTLAAGATSRTINVTVNGDTAVEANETFRLVLSNAVGATIADGTGVATITNDDAAPATPPSLSIVDTSVVEGDSGTRPMTYTVRLSKASTAPVTYSIATSNGTATAGTDYGARSLAGQSIAAGATSRTFAVTVNGDTTPEGSEGVAVNVTGVSGATVADGTAVGTILNDDGPKLSVADAGFAEGNAGTKTMVFTVSMSKAAASPVYFSIATSDATARAGSDYVARSLKGLAIPAGARSTTFAVTVNGDTTVEANESLHVVLSGVSGAGAGIADGMAIGMIVNDD